MTDTWSRVPKLHKILDSSYKVRWIRPLVTHELMSNSRNKGLFPSLRKQLTFCDATTGFTAKWLLRNKHKNTILMTCHYLDLGSTSDWLKQISHMALPVRSTTQISVVERHQYWISGLITQISFAGKPVVTSRNVGCFLRVLIFRNLFICIILTDVNIHN